MNISVRQLIARNDISRATMKSLGATLARATTSSSLSPQRSHARAYITETFTRVTGVCVEERIEGGRSYTGEGAITIKFTQESYAARARMIIGVWERS